MNLDETVTACVTFKDLSEKTFEHIMLGGVKVDSAGALYLMTDATETFEGRFNEKTIGEMRQGTIIAPGKWDSVQVEAFTLPP